MIEVEPAMRPAPPRIGTGKRKRPVCSARFRPAPPVIPHERILRIQGYSDLNRVRRVIRDAAQAAAREAAALSRPVVAYRYMAIEDLQPEGTLRLPGGVELHCPAFPGHLAGCDEVVPFLLTLGKAVPDRVVELVERGDLLEGLLLETAGWLAIEDATRQFKGFLRGECLARGRRITSRMGPGYSYKVAGRACDWSLLEQAALFQALDDGALPLAVMGSCAMNPKMSRSGLYGVGRVDSEAPAAPASGGAPRKTHN